MTKRSQDKNSESEWYRNYLIEYYDALKAESTVVRLQQLKYFENEIRYFEKINREQNINIPQERKIFH